MIEKLENIVDIKIHTKPQNILRHLLNGEYSLILQSNKNSKLLKRLGISKSVNNSFYNPIIGA